MKDVRALLAFFFVACGFVALLAWWHGPESFYIVEWAIGGWLVLGTITGILELVGAANDPKAPKKVRLAGQILRGMFIATIALLVGAFVFDAFSHAG